MSVDVFRNVTSTPKRQKNLMALYVCVGGGGFILTRAYAVKRKRGVKRTCEKLRRHYS